MFSRSACSFLSPVPCVLSTYDAMYVSTRPRSTLCCSPFVSWSSLGSWDSSEWYLERVHLFFIVVMICFRTGVRSLPAKFVYLWHYIRCLGFGSDFTRLMVVFIALSLGSRSLVFSCSALNLTQSCLFQVFLFMCLFGLSLFNWFAPTTQSGAFYWIAGRYEAFSFLVHATIVSVRLLAGAVFFGRFVTGC